MELSGQMVTLVGSGDLAHLGTCTGGRPLGTQGAWASVQLELLVVVVALPQLGEGQLQLGA